MFNGKKRSIFILLSVMVLTTAFVSVAAADFPSSEDREVAEITDNSSVWVGAPFALQADSDDIVTELDESDKEVGVSGNSSTQFGDTGTAKTYENDANITFEYGPNGDFNSSDFADIEDDGQIHLIQLEEENISGVNTISSMDDLEDLLTTDNVNNNASFTDLTSKAGSGAFDFYVDDEFDEPGMYAVLVTLNESGDGISLEGDEIDEIGGNVTVMGMEDIAVEEDSEDTELDGPSEAEPGDTLDYTVNSTLEGEIHHAVAVYDISQVENEDGLEIDIGDEDPSNVSSENITFMSNIGSVSGVANIEDEIIAANQSLVSPDRRDGQFSVQQIFDRIANETDQDAPSSDASGDILDASMTAKVTDGPETTITVETNESWSDSEYRVLYLASTNSSSAEFRTKTLEDSDVGETLTITEDDNGGPTGGTGGGGGAPPAPPAVDDDDDEEPDDDVTEIEDPETPTIEDVRRTLSDVQPTRSSRTPIQDNDPDRPGVTVNPEDSSVSEITFSSDDASGEVGIDEWDNPPQTVADSVRGAVADEVEAEAEDDIEANVSVPTVADIDPDTDEVRNEPATVQITVAADQLNDPDDTVIAHERGNSWEMLETTVAETEDGEVTLEAETESFSYFAVAEVETEDEPAPDDDIGTTGLIGLIVVLALISVAAAVAYREMNSGADEEMPEQ